MSSYINNSLPVNISEKALIEIKEIILNKNIPQNYGLRLGIKGSGCAGIGFLLGFDTLKEQDKVFSHEEVTIYIAKKDIMHLIGKTVDFVDDDARGFVFV
jgi:iron-sulfur cluster assembly protein